MFVGRLSLRFASLHPFCVVRAVRVRLEQQPEQCAGVCLPPVSPRQVALTELKPLKGLRVGVFNKVSPFRACKGACVQCWHAGVPHAHAVMDGAKLSVEEPITPSRADNADFTFGHFCLWAASGVGWPARCV